MLYSTFLGAHYGAFVRLACTKLSMTSIFGMQFLLYTLMVFNDWFNEYHVVYVITSRCKEADMSPWTTTLNKHLRDYQADWRPDVFIINCAPAEF